MTPTYIKKNTICAEKVKFVLIAGAYKKLVAGNIGARQNNLATEQKQKFRISLNPYLLAS